MAAEGISRAEYGSVEIVQGGLPNAEVEVVHCQNEIFEERRALQGHNRAIVSLAFVDFLDILSEFGCLFSSLPSLCGRLDTPIDIDKVALVR